MSVTPGTYDFRVICTAEASASFSASMVFESATLSVVAVAR